jgi:gamma-D-glutamyl-L-lysine dipeptidyl-peptidase
MPESLAVVTIAALDLRRRPNHRSELRSQLLMGELVRVLRKAPGGKWVWVENLGDRYRGWVRTWGLLARTEAEADDWTRRTAWRVNRPHVEVRANRRPGPPLTPLFWNSPVVVVGRSGRQRRILLPNGLEGWVDAAALRPRARTAGSLLGIVRRFRGTPYLWGGRTPLGFDCSGFSQQVLGGRGQCLPRDAHEQFLACRKLGPRSTPRPGDLIFFGPCRGRVTHVGILLGKGLFAHARGAVGVNSLIPDKPLYDRPLARMVRGIGRPPKPTI